MRARSVLLLLLASPSLAQAPAHLGFALESRPLRGLQGPIATLLTTGQEGGGLPMAALALPSGPPGADGRVSVPLLIEIEGNSLLAGRSTDVQRVEVYAYAMGADGAVHDFLAQEVRLDLAQWGEAVLDGGLKLAASVSLPPGPGSVRVLVVDPATLRYSLRVLPVTVPAAGAAPLLLPPLFSDPRGRWTLLRQSGEELEGRLAALLVDDGWGLPSALPLLAGGSTRRVVLSGRGLPADPTVALELRTEFGKPVQAIPGRMAGRSGDRIECDFDLPPLETGRYVAVLTVQVEGGARLETPGLTVLYLRENPLAEELIWAQLRRLGGEAAAPPPVVVEAPKGRKRNAEMERIARQGYDEALRSLASGTPLDQVTTRLAEVESGIYRQGSTAAAESLREVELETARRLGKADPEILLPLAVLHAELYRTLRATHEYYLAENARRTAADLATEYARKGGSGSVAAQALLSLAGDLLPAGVQGTGRALLGQALALDSRNEGAGLYLAASYERDGDYPKVVEILRPVARAHPESAETRLRLGLNLDRTGAHTEAREMLRRLIAEPGPEWVRAVAYEELVRIDRRDGHTADAIALLRQAVTRLPGQPQLAVQLAYLLDRQGDAAAAGKLLDGLHPRSAGAGPSGPAGSSPRHRYVQWPEAALDEARRSLTQQSLLRLAALSRALDGETARGRG